MRGRTALEKAHFEKVSRVIFKGAGQLVDQSLTGVLKNNTSITLFSNYPKLFEKRA